MFVRTNAQAGVGGRVPGFTNSTFAKAVLIFVATFLVLYYRRPDQLFSPYIWVEDGTISLPQYLQHGWTYLFEPVAGYLIVPSKLIQLAALTISADYYPELAFWGTVLFHTAVLCAIAFSRTSLRLPLACALFTLVLPTDSEVYGTSHYAFWWGSLLLLPPLLWSKDADRWLWARCVMIIIGGLSSPLVVVLLPLFLIRTTMYRNRDEMLTTGLVAICACVQLYFVRTTGTHGGTLPDHISIIELVTKFFGYFIYWSPGAKNVSFWLGFGLIGCLTGAAILCRRSLHWHHLAIAVVLVASILISVVRMPLAAIDPFTAGPRYFFYPYIFLGWLLLELLAVVPRRFAALLALALLPGLHQFVLYAPRGHHPIDWRTELQDCATAKGDYKFPIHFAGNRGQIWGVYLASEECKRLIDNSIFQ